MARVTGPSRKQLDERGDEFAARVTRAIRTTLRSVAPTTRVVDDLGRIQTIWRSIVENSLAPHLRSTWDTAVAGVRVQLEAINEREREALLAAVFEIPKVSNPLAESFLAEAQNRLVAIGDVVWYTARGEMLTGMQLGEGVAELRERVVASAKVSQKRAEVIARTEVNSAMNNGAYEQMKALDVATVKEWIATNDSRTRESHEEVDGEEIDGDAKFMVGGFPMSHPHDLDGPPSETINCRCTLAWEIVDDDDDDDNDDYVGDLVAAGDFDEAKHKRDGKGRFAKKAGGGFKVGKKLKITNAWVYKDRPPGTTVAITDDGRSKMVFIGGTGTLGGVSQGPYRHYHRLSTEDEWQDGKSYSKSQAYKWFQDSIADGLNWHEPVSDNDDDTAVDDSAQVSRSKSAKKPTGASDAPLKITHGIVHKKHEPGTIIAVSGSDDKRVVWDGNKYLMQEKQADGGWVTTSTAIKSKAYVEIGKFGDDWHESSDSAKDGTGSSEPVNSSTGPLKITQDLFSKKYNVNDVIIESDDNKHRVIWDGKHYRHQRWNGIIWTTEQLYTKDNVVEKVNGTGLTWHTPVTESAPKPEATPKKTAGVAKSGKAGSPLKITHGLVHSKYEPGDVIAENGVGDKRVVWDGAEYRLQRKTASGSWTSEKNVKKSKAYVEINAYDSDWRVPAQADIVADNESQEEIETTPSSPTPVPPKETPAPPSVAAPSAVIAKAIPTDGYVKTKAAGGTQFKDPEGNEWTLTSHLNANSAKTDVFASYLYSTLGVTTAQTDLVKLDEQNFPNVSKRLGTRKFAVEGDSDPNSIFNTVSFDSHLRNQLYDGFAMDLWLGNTKTAAFENLTVDQDNNLIRDTAGMFGSGSAFSAEIKQSDIDNMRSPFQGNAGNSILNPTPKPAAYVGMPDSKLVAGVRKIASLTPEQIDALVDDMGFGPITTANYKAKLKSRRQSLIDLLEKDYGEAITGFEKTPDPVVAIGPSVPTGSGTADASDAPSTTGVQPKSMDDLTKLSSHKKGGIFKDKNGITWNVQPAPSESHARNQFLAANLYNFAGVDVESTDIVEIDSNKVPGGSGVGVKTLHKPGTQGVVDAMKNSASVQKSVNENFAIDAWLGNWDVVGLGYENLAVDTNGTVRRTNIGGSLLYRANGTPKGTAFNDTVTEIDSLRNPHINPASAKVFANVTDDDIRAGVAKLEKLSPETIDFVITQSGFTGEEAAKLKKTLKARRQDLINKYGSNAPKPAPSTAPASSTQPTASSALGGSTKTYTALQKSKVQGIFNKHNLKWFNKTDQIYDAAHEVSTTHPDLTMADALDIMDQSLKKKSGNPFRTKVEKWLKTKAGKQHALVKGGSASLGGTTPKVSPASSSSQATPVKQTAKYVDHGGALNPQLTRTTANILQQRMNEATPPPWTAAQKSALTKYTGGSYTTINKCARATAPCDPATKKTLNDINAAMKPSTDDIVVYRKTNPSSFGITSGADLQAMVGKTISDNGVISTSIKSTLWTGQLHLEIEAPKGSMIAWVQPISHHPGEDEMVVAPGTHYDIVEVTPPTYEGGPYRVKLRIIPGSDTRSRQEKESAALAQQIADLKKAKASA